MKKSIWLAIIGAAALTGCQNEVMQQREYIPAPREDEEAVRTAPAAAPASTEFAAPRRSAQPAAQELPTMKTNYDNDGISDDSPARGGRRGATGASQAAGAGTYTVQPGDFPEKIARKNHVRLSALMEANGLDEASAKRLRVGQKLVIPGRAAAPSGQRVGKGKRAIGAGPAPAGAGEYVVKAGDTPEKIARRHHVRLSALMEANNFSADDAKRLRVGQKLVIPGRGGRKSAAAPRKGQRAAAAPAQETAPVPSTRTEVDNGYIASVPEDMSIAEFARLNGTTPAKLRELNPDMPEQLVKDGSYVVPKN